MSSFYIGLLGRFQWLKWLVRKTDNDFVVVVCITELMDDFDYDADEITLARGQLSQ